MRAGRWCAASILTFLLAAATATPQAMAETGIVQAADESQSVKPGSNGYGSVTYSSKTSDSSDSSEAAANRLALEEAEALHPNLRLRLGISI